jgi:acyl-CoA hydrolase
VRSMEVQVEVVAKNPQNHAERLIAHSFLTYVGVDPEGMPAQVPAYNAIGALQIQRAEQADLRRTIRQSETSP